MLPGYLNKMLPFFGLGIILKHYMQSFLKYRVALLVVSVIVYITLVRFWSFDYYEYMSPLNKFNICGNMYRMVLASAGTLSFVLTFSFLQHVPQVINYVGSKTMGIYLMNSFFNLVEVFILNRFSIIPDSAIYLSIVLITIAQIVFYIFVMQLFRNNKSVQKILGI